LGIPMRSCNSFLNPMLPALNSTAGAEDTFRWTSVEFRASSDAIDSAERTREKLPCSDSQNEYDYSLHFSLFATRLQILERESEARLRTAMKSITKHPSAKSAH
jgi:hypothetical protein